MYIIICFIIRSVFPRAVRPFIYGALAVGFLLLSLYMICRIVKKKRGQWLSCVALIWALFLTIKFSIRIDTKINVETPQLLYQCESSRVGSKGDILIYYRIPRWPVVLESSISRDYFQEISVAQEKDLQEIMEVVSSDNYTYLASYGAPIQQIEYSFEDGWDIFPYLPIDGREALPKIVFGDESPNVVYIYRIPAVAMDNIG